MPLTAKFNVFSQFARRVEARKENKEDRKTSKYSYNTASDCGLQPKIVYVKLSKFSFSGNSPLSGYNSKKKQLQIRKWEALEIKKIDTKT